MTEFYQNRSGVKGRTDGWSAGAYNPPVNGSQLDQLRSAAADFFAGTDVTLAYAYGSRIDGRPRPDSDLDIGYYLTPPWRETPLSIAAEMKLAGQLSGAAGLDVDFRHLGQAPLDLKGRVLEEGKRIYSRDEVARVNFERDLIGRYHDYKFIYQRMHATRLAALAKKVESDG